MAWPQEDPDRQGLLPDFFLLESQHRDGPAINPGTTQAHLPDLFDVGRIYAVRRLPSIGCFVHAPCAIYDVTERDDGVSFAVQGWGAGRRLRPYSVLVSGWQGAKPYVTVRGLGEGSDGASPWSLADTEHIPGSKLVIIHLDGPAEVGLFPRVR
jgi:hypothetical protein